MFSSQTHNCQRSKNKESGSRSALFLLRCTLNYTSWKQSKWKTFSDKVKTCSFATQLVCKMLNLTFKKKYLGLCGMMTWASVFAAYFIFFCPKRSDLLLKRASPLTWHFQPSVNRLDVHKCGCIHLRVTDTILKITCTSILRISFCLYFLI